MQMSKIQELEQMIMIWLAMDLIYLLHNLFVDDVF